MILQPTTFFVCFTGKLVWFTQNEEEKKLRTRWIFGNDDYDENDAFFSSQIGERDWSSVNSRPFSIAIQIINESESVFFQMILLEKTYIVFAYEAWIRVLFCLFS